MLLKASIVSVTLLVSGFAQASDSLDLHGRPADICYPALQALQTPTTEENLTRHDPFKDTYLEPEFNALPSSFEPTTAAIAMWFLKIIAIEIGNKVFEKYFGSAKRGLTEKDFQRIDQIVRQALREDAMRKIDDCLYNLQYNNKLIAGDGWDEQMAKEIFTTSTAIFNNIKRFDHFFSRVALFPSAELIGSMQLALGQELIKRKAIPDTLFTRVRDNMADSVDEYLSATNFLVDPRDKRTYHLASSSNMCSNDKRDALCFRIYSKIWGEVFVNIPFGVCVIEDGKTKQQCVAEYERKRDETIDKMHDKLFEFEGKRKTISSPESGGPATDIYGWKKAIQDTPLRVAN